MRLLLDTHALLWWTHEPEELSRPALDAIMSGENDVSVSAVSAMEIATKSRLGKFAYVTPLASEFGTHTAAFGFIHLPITCDHAERAGGLPGTHRDPWDRLIAAQAQLENLTLVSRDVAMAGFGVTTFW